MPFSGLIALPVLIALLCWIWILFPAELLSEEEFKKHLKTYVLYSIWWFVMNIQKDILTLVFKTTPFNLEWLFAFVVPCFREINKRVLTKLVHKMAGSDNESANVLLGMNINVHYALFIAIRLSGSHISTVSCTVAIDFILHLRMAYQLIQLRNKTTTDLNEHEQRRRNEKRTILKLVLAEMCKELVALAYAIGFSRNYFNFYSALWTEL